MSKRQNRKRIWIYDFLIVILVIIIVAIAGILIAYFINIHKSQGKIEDLKSYIKVENGEEAETNKEKRTKNKKIENEFKNLYEMNSDFIGWISINDTMIDYPVMQNMTDNQYYLHRDFYKNYDFSGLIFADNRCDIKNSSTNIILYGHHMKSGTMFAGLLKYKDNTYFENHRIVNFDTIYGKRTYQIFAAFYAEIYDIDDNKHFKYYDFIDASDQEEFDNAINNIKSMSYYKEDFPKYGDEILTLSTCGNGDEQSRFVVMGERIKDE